MNVLDFFVNSYSYLKNYGMPYWVMTPARRIIRLLAHSCLPKYLVRPTTKSPVNCEGLIVSFTSFPARIKEVWQVVECMKRQSMLPEKIILWLSKDQFPDTSSVPQSLWDRVDDLFCIRFVDGDIRSHKKYYYVANEYPNKLIFLIDDDIYYDTDILSRSVREFNKYEKCVVCNYGYHIKYDVNNSVCRYNTWQHCYERSESEKLFFGSGGGTLFKPSLMYKDLTNIDVARKLAPLADDIWLNAMAKKAGLKIVLLKNGQILPIHNEENITLSSVNVGESQNDIQLKAVLNYYNLH